MVAVSLKGVGKSYRIYRSGLDRIFEAMSGRSRHRSVEALHPVDLEIERGEVLGLIGRNGAGKSTLLKLVAGTVQPSCGTLAVNGRVSALLELGSGFHPELSGRQNVFLAGAVMGLKQPQIEALFDSIAEFAGIGAFMEQPVKTYSSGMFVRLAFAVATCVEPEILIVDEALSVGDGAFARKSFDRIMSFRERGSTILFCSHSLYQVEALCNRVAWIEQGRLMSLGEPAAVTAAYADFLAAQERGSAPAPLPEMALETASQVEPAAAPACPAGGARLLGVELEADGLRGRKVTARSGRSDLRVRIRFVSDPAIPPPSVAIEVKSRDDRTIASAGSRNDGFAIPRDAAGVGEVEIVFARLPLLKGSYDLSVHVLCENGVHVYESVAQTAEIQVQQSGLEQGVVSLPHQWQLPLSRRLAS